MRPERAWVRLESGRRLNLVQPDPDSWTDRDLAIGLSRTYRWGGHSCWNLPLSVAQHSLLVLMLRQKITPLDKLTRGEALRELLHDADEGMLSFDPISPLKPHLGADYDSLISRLRTAIETRYDIPAWDDESYAAHKRADRLAAASEAVHVAGWSQQDLPDTLGIQTRPLAEDPLPALTGLKPWEPWPARTAAALFLAKLRELTGSESLEYPADLDACMAREKTVVELATAFSRLPPGRRLLCSRPPTVADQISLLLDATGYRAMLRESKPETTEDKLKNIQELIGLAGDFHTARDLLDYAALSTSGPHDESADRVRLMTMHKGKGLEFPHVFLPAWEAGTFPPNYGDISEERRLGYVAITRGMRRVTITHCEFRRGYTSPSSFIEDFASGQQGERLAARASGPRR
jgi:superfamily I DNA/RNA helicase